MIPSWRTSSRSPGQSGIGRATPMGTSVHSYARSSISSWRVRSTVDGTLTPETLTAVPDEALRAAGQSGNKLASLRDLSAKILDGTLDLKRSSRLSDEDLVAALVTVRGIGRWTAEMYLMFELRRLDVWPVDDLGVRQGYGLAWDLAAAPSAKELVPFGDRFRPYRSIVARYCWAAVVLFRGGTDPALR